MVDEYGLYISALVPILIVWIFLRMVGAPHRLLDGQARREAFSLPSKTHPKPSIHWKLSDRMSYRQGLVSVRSMNIWWQSFTPPRMSSNTFIVMYHGYGDHSDYILHEVAHDLAMKSNLTVIVFDQPGFGRSDGLWGYIPEWRDHVCVCADATNAIVKLHTNDDVSLIGYGHSMGGGLLITAAILYPSMFSCLVLSAPMCGVSPSIRKPIIVENFLFFLASIIPKAPITPVPDLGALCFEDPDFYEYTKKTNHLGYRAKPRLATAKSLLLAQEWISSHAHSLHTPYLMLHGDKDMVTSLDSSVLFHQKAASRDKTLKVMRGYYHSILGPGQPKQKAEKAFQIVVDWIRDHS